MTHPKSFGCVVWSTLVEYESLCKLVGEWKPLNVITLGGSRKLITLTEGLVVRIKRNWKITF